MTLNHLHLYVSDVQAMVTTLETFFGLKLESSRTSPAFAIVSDGQGFTLVLQRQPGVVYPEGFHFGFNVADIATVERTHALLAERGQPVTPIEKNNRGTMIYCQINDGIVVEVSCPRVS